MADREYQRLARTRARWAGLASAVGTRSSLWLGQDHLLCVDAAGYAENYKRFYFRDIQAFVLVASRRRAIWNWVFGSATLLCLVGWGLTLASAELFQLGWVLAGVVLTLIFIVPLVINNLLGPACNCYVRTAVQVELLPSLSRVARTRKVLDRLRPLIIAAQGQLSVEEIERQWLESSAAPPVIVARPAPAVLPPKPYQGPFHHVLAWLLLADLPLTAADLALAPGTLDAVSMVFLMIVIGMAIVCLVKQSETDLPASLKRIPWMTLASTGGFLFVGILYGIVAVASNPGRSMERLTREDPVMMALTLVSTTLWVVLGLIGLIGWRRFNEVRTGARANVPPAVEPGS